MLFVMIFDKHYVSNDKDEQVYVEHWFVGPNTKEEIADKIVSMILSGSKVDSFKTCSWEDFLAS